MKASPWSRGARSPAVEPVTGKDLGRNDPVSSSNVKMDHVFPVPGKPAAGVSQHNQGMMAQKNFACVS